MRIFFKLDVPSAIAMAIVAAFAAGLPYYLDARGVLPALWAAVVAWWIAGLYLKAFIRFIISLGPETPSEKDAIASERGAIIAVLPALAVLVLLAVSL